MRLYSTVVAFTAVVFTWLAANLSMRAWAKSARAVGLFGFAALMLAAAPAAAQSPNFNSYSANPANTGGIGSRIVFTIGFNSGNRVATTFTVTSALPGVTYTCSPYQEELNQQITCSGTYYTTASDVANGRVVERPVAKLISFSSTTNRTGSIITVPVAANIPPPVGNSFTANAVAYNAGSASINLADHITYDPTDYSVSGSANGGSVSVNSAGIVTYTPPVGFRGNDSFTFTGTNASATSSPATVTVPVGNPTLAISRTGSGQQGVALSGVSITATGGQAPYSCATSVASGALPAGVSLNSNCTLTGTPSVSGTFNFTVAVTDSSTGTGPFTQVSGPLSLTLTPAVPVVSSISPTAGPTGGGTTVVITGNYLLGASAVTFGATPATGFTVNSTTQITATAPAGTGTVDVRVTTAGGQSATSAADQYTWVPAPTVTSISPTAGPASGGTTVTITGTNLSGATAVTFGATTATGFTVNSATQITATAPAGTGTVDVRITTVGGTSATSAADQYTFIPTPTVTSISPTAGPTSGGTTVTLTGTNFTGVTAVTFGATPATGFTFNGPTSITATAPAHSAGTVDIRVTTGGGTSATSAADQFIYVTAPTVTSVTPTAGPTGGGTTVIITGSGFAAAPGTGAVKFGATNATYTINSNTQITATAPAGAAGTVDVTVTTVGGTSATSAADQFTYVPVPTVTSISPSAGPGTGGTTVTITGTGLSGATAVTFGATSATGFTVNSGSSITATAPAGTGTVDIRVTTVGGTSATSAADQYTFIPAPTVTSISPTAGPASGGTAVTITGANFTGVTAVTFGATPATGFTFNSATSITATAPAGTGTVDVRITTAGGTSATSAADQFTYVAAPVVTSISPSAGPTSGGTTVTITGTGFLGATALTFGATPATGFTVVNATTVTATAPAGTGTVDVRVTTIGGTSATGAADQFTYVPAPTVTSISPSAGPTTGGTAVTITGTNFSGATALTFGATPASGITVVNATTITATAPAGTGTVDVRVTTAGGTSATSAADQFTYIPAPTVTSITPTAGPTSGGTAVTITGTNFSGATALTFGATPATGITVVNATTITATAPAGTGTVDVRVTTGGGTSATSAADQFTYVAPPAAPVTTTPADGSSTGDNTPTYTGTAPAGSTVTVYIDGSSIGTTTATGGAWTKIQPVSLADGSHTVWSTATTIGGASAPSNTNSFTVDTTAPNAPVVTAPANGATINTAAAPVSGTAEADSTVTVIVDGAVSGTATANGSGNWSFTTAPLVQGSHTVRATATDASGNTSTTSGTITFTYSPLSLPAATLANGQVGVVYTAAVTADGGVSPYSYTVTGGALPAGLDLASNGSISGTPTASGTFNFTVTVTDGNSLTASQSFAITVAAPAPPTADPEVVVVVVTPGGGGSSTIDLSGAASNAERIEVVDQPANGSVTVNGFVVTFTPQPGFFGVVTFTYKAIGYSNGGVPGAESAPATVTITIPDPVLALTGGALPGGTVAAAYSQTLSASGGTAPYTYAVTAGALPAGLSLSTGGVISGTPTAGGTFNFTVSATDSSTGTGPFVISGAYSLTIAAPTIVLAPATLPAATTAASYSQSFTASGGTGSYTYAVTAGALPAGLSLSPAGVLSGTPTAGGAFNFTVTATDQSTGAGPYTGSQVYDLTVNAATIAVTPATIPNASRGFAYSASLSASGGTGSYAYTLSSGALPAGVSLSPTGVISGTPTVTGSFSFQVRATDQSTGSGPYSGTVNLTLTVNAATITVTPTTLPNVMAGFAYDRSLTATGGSGAYSYAVTAGALPTGITLSTAGRISGTSYQVGTATFTVTATDAFGNTGSVPLSLQVIARPDPSQDPDVRGLDAAQAEATRRLTSTQIDNFSRRLEQLHAGGGTQTVSMGLSLNTGVMQLEQDADLRTRLGGGRMFGQDGGRPVDPDRAALNAMVWSARADGRNAGAASDALGYASTGGSIVNGGLNAGQSDGAASTGGLRFWTGGAITVGERDAETGQSAFSVRSSGISVGADMAVTPTLDIGVGGGFGEEQADIGSADSGVDSSTFVGVVYGSWRPATGVYLDAMVGYGQLAFDLQRRATGDDSLVTGERDGSVVFGSIGLGFDRTVLETGRLSAYGRVETLNGELDAYTETGSPLWALSYDARDVESLQGVWGARFTRSYAQRDTIWTPGVRLEYRHEFAEGGVQNLGYADWSGGPVYQIQSTGWERGELNLGLGLDVQTQGGWTATTEIGGRFSADQTLGTLKLLFSRRF